MYKMSTVEVQSPIKLKTSCKDCCFGEYNYNFQKGCSVRPMQLGKYHYEPDGTRMIHTHCQFKRVPPWGEDLTCKEKLALVHEEITIVPVPIIEYARGQQYELLKTLDSIKAQTLAPKEVIVVDYMGDGEEAFNALKDCGIKWQLEEILEDTVDWRDGILSKYKKSGNMFTFLKRGRSLDHDFFEALNNKINYKDLRFGAIHEENLLLIPYGVYFVVFPSVPVRYIPEEAKNYDIKVLKYEDIIAGK